MVRFEITFTYYSHGNILVHDTRKACNKVFNIWTILVFNEESYGFLIRRTLYLSGDILCNFCMWLGLSQHRGSRSKNEKFGNSLSCWLPRLVYSSAVLWKWADLVTKGPLFFAESWSSTATRIITSYQSIFQSISPTLPPIIQRRLPRLTIVARHPLRVLLLTTISICIYWTWIHLTGRSKTTTCY